MTDIITLMALFNEDADMVEVIDELHDLGIPDDKIVVLTGVPYPEGALGRHREWLTLPLIVLAGAAAGMIFGLFLAVITPHLYRLDVGGHPTVSFPPTAVIIFVFTMMATIVATFLGVLWEMNFPRFGPAPYHKLITDGNLAVFVDFPPIRENEVRQTLEAHHAHHIGEPELIAL